MYFDGTYRFIGAVDPEPLRHAIESLGEEAWSEYGFRQQTYYAHKRTQTIPLLYDADLRHTDPTTWPGLTQFQPALEPVLQKIRDANPPVPGGAEDGYFIRIILARLNPHGWINRHRDDGDTLLRSHRNHLAITTNPLVEFEVGDEARYLAPGDIWEINNRAEHAVRNKSDHARVHMIIDYVVPGERIDDPDGVVFG